MLRQQALRHECQRVFLLDFSALDARLAEFKRMWPGVRGFCAFGVSRVGLLLFHGSNRRGVAAHSLVLRSDKDID
jgi:hypothetical protein